MTPIEQIQQDIQTLPPEALNLLAQFIQLLKKTFSTSQTPQTAQKNIYEQFENSGLIGCISAEENLSTNYKEILAEEWGRKYDHR
jgi:fatty acid-binding protein DegV